MTAIALLDAIDPLAHRLARIAFARPVAASDTVAFTASKPAFLVASSPMREVVPAGDDDGSSAWRLTASAATDTVKRRT